MNSLAITQPALSDNQHPRCGMVLLTGATGYVGGRLLALLERRGIKLRCLARRLEALRGRTGPNTEVALGDVLDRSSLDEALLGVDTAYYLVHSMGTARDFEQEDRNRRDELRAGRRSCRSTPHHIPWRPREIPIRSFQNTSAAGRKQAIFYGRIIHT